MDRRLLKDNIYRGGKGVSRMIAGNDCNSRGGIKRETPRKKSELNQRLLSAKSCLESLWESIMPRDKSAQLDCLITTGKKMYVSLFVGRPASPGNTIRSLDRRFYYCIVIS